MDESGSIDSDDFDREKNFVAALADGFSNFGPNGVQMAVITYATAADLDIKLSEHSTKSSFMAAVKKIRQRGKCKTIPKYFFFVKDVRLFVLLAILRKDKENWSCASSSVAPVTF